MEPMVERARLYEDMSDFIMQAHKAARVEGFSTIIIGDRYAVISGQSSLAETLDGCLAVMVDSAMRAGH